MSASIEAASPVELSPGVEEPAPSRVLMTVLAVGVLGFFLLFSVVFGWDGVPALEDLGGAEGTGSGIWFYLAGIAAGLVPVGAAFLMD